MKNLIEKIMNFMIRNTCLSSKFEKFVFVQNCSTIECLDFCAGKMDNSTHAKLHMQSRRYLS